MNIRHKWEKCKEANKCIKYLSKHFLLQHHLVLIKSIETFTNILTMKGINENEREEWRENIKHVPY